MTRQEAYEFIQLYRKFATSGLSIADISQAGEKRDVVLLQFADGSTAWKTDWYAAKVIEAESDTEEEKGTPCNWVGKSTIVLRGDHHLPVQN